MRLICPGCGASLDAGDPPAGAKLRCVSCGTAIRAPAQEGTYEPTEPGRSGREALSRQPIATGQPFEQVAFVREERRDDFGATMTFRVHRAPSAEAAKAFLEGTEIHKQLLHIVVETPEGNFGRDIQGMYEE